jgi:hypothetical protein
MRLWVRVRFAAGGAEELIGGLRRDDLAESFRAGERDSFLLGTDKTGYTAAE